MTPKSFNKAMGRAVNLIRKMHGLTLAQVGQPLGVSYQQAQKFVAGTNALSAYQLFTIAKLFNMTVADLYKQAGVNITAEPSAADNDGFLAARYVAKIASPTLRRNFIDFARKCAYPGAEA